MSPNQFTTDQLLRRYFSGDLTAPQEAELERRALTDPVLAEALGGLYEKPAVDHAARVSSMLERARSRVQSTQQGEQGVREGKPDTTSPASSTGAKEATVRRFNYRRWAGIAAALLLIVSIFALFPLGGGEGEFAQRSAPAEDPAAPLATQSAAEETTSNLTVPLDREAGGEVGGEGAEEYRSETTTPVPPASAPRPGTTSSGAVGGDATVSQLTPPATGEAAPTSGRISTNDLMVPQPATTPSPLPDNGNADVGESPETKLSDRERDEAQSRAAAERARREATARRTAEREAAVRAATARDREEASERIDTEAARARREATEAARAEQSARQRKQTRTPAAETAEPTSRDQRGDLAVPTPPSPSPAAEAETPALSQEVESFSAGTELDDVAVIPAQTYLVGRVADENGKPIVGAVVKLPGLPIGETTDSTGVFRLPADATTTAIIIDHPDYEREEFTVNRRKEDLQLTLEAKQTAVEWTDSWSVARVQVDPLPNVPGYALPTEGYNALRERLIRERPANVPRGKVRFSFLVDPSGSLSDFQFRGRPDRATMDYLGTALLQTTEWEVLRGTEPVRVYFKVKL